MLPLSFMITPQGFWNYIFGLLTIIFKKVKIFLGDGFISKMINNDLNKKYNKLICKLQSKRKSV